MGNQQSVGWVSNAALDENEVIDVWVNSFKQYYANFSDEQLHLETGEGREVHFRNEIIRLLRDPQHKRFLVYRTDKVFSYAVVADKDEFIQIYGIAIHPYSVFSLRSAALMMFKKLQQEYDKELRGMVRAINSRGIKLYKYLGAEQCDDWHDTDYDEHHTPLRISSTAAKLAAEKSNNTKLPVDDCSN